MILNVEVKNDVNNGNKSYTLRSKKWVKISGTRMKLFICHRFK